MKISASTLISCVYLSRCLCVCLFNHYTSQFKSNLHQTSHTGRHQYGEELQGHVVRGQGHARSDDHGNFVKSMDPKLLNGFEPRLTQILNILLRFKVMGSKVKVIQQGLWNFG